MRALVWGVIAAAFIGETAFAGAFVESGTDAAIKKLTTAGGCKKKKPTHKEWCVAADWAKGEAAPLPKKTLVGIEITMSGHKKPTVGLAAVVIKNGEVVRTSWDGKDTAGHAKANAIKAITAVLAGTADSAKLDGDAVTRLDADKTYKPVSKDGAWVWSIQDIADDHLRKVGNVWVEILTMHGDYADPGGSAMVTVLTDAWTQ